MNIRCGRQTQLSRISAQAERPRLRGAERPGHPSVGNFMFMPEGLRCGQEVLSLPATAGADVVMVDEVGPWELQDQGWAGPLYALTLETETPMVWIVRSDIVDRVCEHWALQDPRIADWSPMTPEILLKEVREWLERGDKRK